jgi:hypothetical protein
MSGTSNVGNSQVYEAGDQRTVPDSQIQQEKKDARFHEGKENSHKANDSSKYFVVDDSEACLTCINRGREIDRQQACSRREGSFDDKAPAEEAAREKSPVLLTNAQREKEGEQDSPEVAASKKDPTLPVNTPGISHLKKSVC